MPNHPCPLCGNRDHVYADYDDPRLGPFILCSRHGIQVCQQVPNLPEECLECGAACSKVERDICLSQWW